jgi:O-acetyl-ADP-ribose deacetylase (regulator of RNase III)
VTIPGLRQQNLATITPASKLKIGGSGSLKEISLYPGDITIAPVDAIVNATNPVMLGGGGVDGAIHRAAGPGLLEACRRVSAVKGIRCPTGEARITPAADLCAHHVIHTVGPRYHIDPDPEKLLASAYRNSLELALGNGCRSIAFPAISCGVYGYPLDQAAAIAVSVCSEPRYAALHISFYLFGDQAMNAWRGALARK